MPDHINSLNFPIQASNQASHTRFGREYTYDSSTDSWLAVTPTLQVLDPSKLSPKDYTPVIRDDGDTLQNGDSYYNTIDETTYTWDETSGYWRRTSAGAVVSDTAPVDLYDGLIWQDTIAGGTYIYNQSGDTWIEAGGAGGYAVDPLMVIEPESNGDPVASDFANGVQFVVQYE